MARHRLTFITPPLLMPRRQRTPLRLLASPEDFTPEPGKRYALLSYRGDAEDGYLTLTDWHFTTTLSPGTGSAIISSAPLSSS